MRQEIGDVIAIRANSLRLLEKWGLDLKALRGTPLLQERGLIEDTGEIIFSLEHSYVGRKRVSIANGAQNTAL